MINRYTYAPIGRTPHMEPMGAGEWVKWDDHASQLAAANQRHAAALEAVARARDAGLTELSLAINSIPTREEKLGGQTFKYVQLGEVNDTILTLRTKALPVWLEVWPDGVKPPTASVDFDDIRSLPEVDQLSREAWADEPITEDKP